MTAELPGFPIRELTDVDRARRAARALAADSGLDGVQTEELLIAVAELGTNLVRYAEGGVLGMSLVEEAGRTGVEVASSDAGPGIADLMRAMRDGYSSGTGLGAGLPAVRRLMDDLEVSSTPAGTRIIARKWARPV